MVNQLVSAGLSFLQLITTLEDEIESQQADSCASQVPPGFHLELMPDSVFFPVISDKLVPISSKLSGISLSCRQPLSLSAD